jgi:hypothetical protein
MYWIGPPITKAALVSSVPRSCFALKCAWCMDQWTLTKLTKNWLLGKVIKWQLNRMALTSGWLEFIVQLCISRLYDRGKSLRLSLSM